MTRQQRENAFVTAYNQKNDVQFDKVLLATLDRIDFLNSEIARYRTELNRIAWPREGDDIEPMKIAQSVLNISRIKGPHDLCANQNCKICAATTTPIQGV